MAEVKATPAEGKKKKKVRLQRVVSVARASGVKSVWQQVRSAESAVQTNPAPPNDKVGLTRL